MSPNSDPEDGNTSSEAPKSKRKYLAGMLIYGVLALLAGWTLDGNIRIATWIFLAGIALKTCISAWQDRMD